MGKQINFYLTPADNERLDDEIRSAGPVVYLSSRSDSNRPTIIEGGSGASRSLFMHLVRPEDIDAIVMREIPAQLCWTIDVLKSPVIEFNKCFYDGKVLRRGRLYFQESYYDSHEQPVKKDPAFIHWAESIVRLARRTLLKNESFGYIGVDAKNWLESSGGKLDG